MINLVHSSKNKIEIIKNDYFENINLKKIISIGKDRERPINGRSF